jgi:uncharacterized protein YndB with AHSA1/START domain/DNA-binding transcriptional ArsR family regulator
VAGPHPDLRRGRLSLPEPSPTPALPPTADAVFRALADPGRRRLLDRLRERNGQNLRELCSGLDMARQSVSKHLAVLEAANLVTTVRQGREKLHYLNPAPINEVAERWITHYERPRVAALAALKRGLEAPMDKPEFMYTTYIRTTPERLWQALTDAAFMKQWWTDTALHSDWEVGSTVRWDHHGVMIEDPAQVVVESDPPRRLSYTWHTMTPEWAEAVGFTPERQQELASERRSTVTFDLEPVGETVKLTVMQGGFEPGGKLVEMVGHGWPQLLPGLKKLLEDEVSAA